MSKIVLGTRSTGATKGGSHNVTLDLELLLTTRMLLTADSGGGKTVALKRLCEQVFGKMQILVVDPEGEFSPLRTKFDFLLAGPGGETPADVRSARLLATRLLETRVSAICDLYEMNARERHEWVRLFLEGLIEAPKKLRHPCLVIVDEAHIFCPEKGKGESTASEMMIALCTRGRKRLLCPLFATQRLATLSKDASSMLLNRMIGPTFEDVNRKRAIEVLSIAREEQAEFTKAIQLLEPGHFYALGRAICRERTLLHVGAIETPHGEEALKYETAPPPPLDKVKALMPQLADLPKQAEEKAKTEAELRKEIRELKTQLRAQPKAEAPKVVADLKAVDKAVKNVEQQYQRQVGTLRARLQGVATKLSVLARDLAKVRDVLVATQAAAATVAAFATSPDDLAPIERPKLDKPVVSSYPQISTIKESVKPAVDVAADNGELSKPQVAILRALAEFEALGREELPKTWVAVRAGASATSSSFGNNLGALRSKGLIDYPQGGKVRLTAAGREHAPAVDPPTTSDEMLASCLRLLSEPQRKILQVVYDRHPQAIEKQAVAELAGASATSSSFGNNLGALRSAGMIEYSGGGTVKCADWLFVE